MKMKYENLAKFLYPHKVITAIRHYEPTKDGMPEHFVFEDDKEQIATCPLPLILDEICKHLNQFRK